MPLLLLSPVEMATLIAKRVKAKRLALNFSQRSLADRSNVSYGVIKKFERTGKISLESLLKIAMTLDAMDEFDLLFKQKSFEQFASLDELLKNNTRERGRT